MSNNLQQTFNTIQQLMENAADVELDEAVLFYLMQVMEIEDMLRFISDNQHKLVEAASTN